MAEELRPIHTAVLEGNAVEAEARVRDALKRGIAPGRILDDGLIPAMRVVGDQFERGELYIPEMLVAARAMQAGLAVLKPHLSQAGVKAKGKMVIGTAQGDLHDIGKNLVAMMLEGAGFEVVDLGIDVSADRFVEAVRDHAPQLVGISALLTTTMGTMKSVVKSIESSGLRDKVKIMVGGAPVTEAFSRRIGADGYAPDAGRAVMVAQSLL